MPCPADYPDKFRSLFPDDAKVVHTPEDEFYDEKFVAMLSDGAAYAIHVTGDDRLGLNYLVSKYDADKTRTRIANTNAFDKA